MTKLSKYSIVNPQPIHRWPRSINRLSPSKENNGEETISYLLKINNKEHAIHLKKNRDFLHPKFVEDLLNKTSDHTSSYPEQWVHCYYHGEVEGWDNSMVALSTCSGLRGVIILGNETYGLEPVPQSTTNEHLLYLMKDIQSEPATCGVISEAASMQSHEPFEPGQSLTSLLRRKRNLPYTSYVELVLVVDNLKYNKMDKNEKVIRAEMVELTNLLDGYYKQLNIRVVLVGLKIFSSGNPFDVNGSAGEVLKRFVDWRKTDLLPDIRHDIGQLIVGQKGAYPGGVLGMAFVGSVCSAATSGGINVFTDNNLAFFSTVVAHEIGHNMGMNHDRTGCGCNGNCIMGSAATGAATFSSCSREDFESLILRGRGLCLRNMPPPSNVIGTAECGNGRVDQGEQCDCGKPEECTNKCCDAVNCTFTFGSTCAHGLCCDNCKIQVSGTPCRPSLDPCDLPEYCTGSNGSCPSDFYFMDGLPCLNSSAYCYEGRCQTYDFQCKRLFAQDAATKADDICFSSANIDGTLFGNCGLDSKGQPIKCTPANAMCGKVQCTNVDVNNPPPGAHASIQIIEGKSCVNADFRLGSDVLDPAYVKPGSPCGEGKTCLNFACVNASALRPNFTCDAQATCNGRGKCNNNGHCHCDNGWAPPNCDKAGRGGSVDSGPAEIDYSLRNGLLIFFLLVVPVLVLIILVLLYVFRRQSFDPCLKRRRRSHDAQNGNANRNRNVQSSATTQPPVPARPPTETPVNLPATPGFRYGEVDYWNAETNPPPAPTPASIQGPGVPKPIPPRQPAN
ncbi:disintegrin and metalloproteinase domain-containing protein 9 isoform X2 [Mastacembelus armatus]|nr:disintegrin and metalloproteinase domain-containing protein 9-like isoform X2 [Mastacembelus armatus]XP_026171511.1 disintegrin and metalloproteinase domain-containing protein 9-like isoform X2 [Mastacembelus armatus]